MTANVRLWYAQYSQGRLVRAKIREIYRGLSIGATRADVRQRVKLSSDPEIRLDFHCADQELWSLVSPLEPEGKNWVVYMRFRGDKLVVLSVRSQYNGQERPKDDPPADRAEPVRGKSL